MAPVFGAVVWGWIQVAVAVASVAYQMVQAKKQRAAAAAAAEARKGFEMVVEGDIQTLPIVYGKALIGGVRAWHTTGSTFTNAVANGQKSFNIGPPATPSGSYTVPQVDEDGNPKRDAQGHPLPPLVQTYPGTAAGFLSVDFGGKKNEFLFFQQALCQGPINNVVDVIINESLYLDDPTLGTVGKGGRLTSDGVMATNKANAKAAMRIDLHYDGGVADAMIAKNYAERSTALFSEAAYASVAIRLDRDDPQFGGVPVLQFMVEGALVRKVVGGVLSETRVYSNNPAWCLLDYLLHKRSGKALELRQIDLPTFEAAAAVCDTIVQMNVGVGGKFYSPTDKSRSITNRNLPLYECNIVLDTSKPLRGNVESILSTMGDARLVWSAGKYKLLVQYPATNEAIQVAAELTDDDLVMGGDIDISWPSSSERLNNCTVRFHNECEGFKEDSATWPVKTNGSYFKGIGGRYFYPRSGWNDTSEEDKFLNSYAVWDGNTSVTTMVWKLLCKTSGVHTIRYAGDCTYSISIQGDGVSRTIPGLRKIGTETLSLVADKIYTITLSGTKTDTIRGIAGIITSPSGNGDWTTRSPAYSSYVLQSMNNQLYLQIKAEDNNIELETDVFSEGITDYYHALAKAEELVRTSRSAFGIKLSYIVRDRYLEPGDIIVVNSKTLRLGTGNKLYVRVNEVKINDNGTCEIVGTRFDWTQLAWNVKDDEMLKPNGVYEFAVARPEWLEYRPDANSIKGSAGTLECAAVSHSNLAGYIFYAHIAKDMDTDGAPIFNELGRSGTTKFELPAMSSKFMIFGVKAYLSTGAVSAMTVTDPNAVVSLRGPTPPAPIDFKGTLTGTFSDSVKLTWVNPEIRPDLTPYDDHYQTFIYRSKTNNFETSVRVGVTELLELTERPTDFGTLYYWAVNVSLLGGMSAPSLVATVLIKSTVPGQDDTPVATPTGFKVSALFSNFQLSWDYPYYIAGGGPNRTLIYAAPWPSGTPMPVFNEAFLVASALGTMYNYPAKLGSRYVFWIKWQSQGGGKSTLPAGPVSSQTGLVGGVDLGPLIITADKIAEGGVTLSKFTKDIEPVTLVDGDTVPTVKSTTVIMVAGVLYRWDGAAYTAAVKAVDVKGQLTNEQIAEIDAAKIGGKLTDEQIESVAAAKVAGQITGVQITDNAISAEKISAGAIVAGKIAAGTIVAGDIATDAITADKIKASSVSAAKMVAGTITANEIAAGSITAYNIAGNTITANEIAAGAISTNQLAANAITAGKIAVGAVRAGEIAANGVTANNMSAGSIAVGSLAVANGAIRNALIEDLAVDNAKIANAAITTAKIGIGEVDTLRVADGAVTTTMFSSCGISTIPKGGASHIMSATIDMGSVTNKSGVVIHGNVNYDATGNNIVVYMRVYRVRDSVQIGFTWGGCYSGDSAQMAILAFDPDPQAGYNSYHLYIENPTTGPGSNKTGGRVQWGSMTTTGGKR